MLDKDDSHKLEEGEFLEGLKQLGLSKSDAEDKAAFKEVDADGHGTVSLNEFCDFILKHPNHLPTPSE